VLLREAHDLCTLRVSVFRPGMSLAHSRYAEDLSSGRPVSRYEGIAVDFLADSITATGLGN
jgi:fatty acid CoA ligase FadD9